MICPQCKSKFRLVDRIKSMNKKNSSIQCSNCNNIFVQKKNSGKLLSALVTGILVFIGSNISLSLNRQYFSNNLLNNIIISIIIVIILFVFYLVSQNWLEYEKTSTE